MCACMCVSEQRQLESDVVEIVGIVNPDRSVTENRSTDFGNDMDLKQVEILKVSFLLNLLQKFAIALTLENFQQYNEMLLLANGGVRAVF